MNRLKQPIKLIFFWLSLIFISCKNEAKYNLLEEKLIVQLGDPDSYKPISLDTIGVLSYTDSTFYTRDFLRLKYYNKNEYNSQVIGIHYFIVEDQDSIIGSSSQLSDINHLIPLRMYIDYMIKIGVKKGIKLNAALELSQEEINRLDISNWN